MPLLPCMFLTVLIPILAWRFGLSVNAKALVAFGVSGLVMTAAGIAILLGLVALLLIPQTPQGHNLAGTGMFFLFGALLGLQIESLGGLLTLASCSIGLRQVAQRRPRWFWILLAGAFLPLIVCVGIGAFVQTDGDVFARMGPQIQGISVSLIVALILPLVAAIVTTTYAIRRARGMRGQAVVEPRSI